jgi:hypothetical protein
MARLYPLLFNWTYGERLFSHDDLVIKFLLYFESPHKMDELSHWWTHLEKFWDYSKSWSKLLVGVPGKDVSMDVLFFSYFNLIQWFYILSILPSRLVEYEFSMNRRHTKVEWAEPECSQPQPVVAGTLWCQVKAKWLMVLIGFSTINELMWVYILLRGE